MREDNPLCACASGDDSDDDDVATNDASFDTVSALALGDAAAASVNLVKLNIAERSA